MRPTMQMMTPKRAGQARVMNASLVWLDERGRTRAETASCAGPVIGSGVSGRAPAPCYDRNGALIPQDKILAASPHTPYVPPPYPGTIERCEPTVMRSQEDVNAWNATHRGCPLPPFGALCPPGGRPPATERDAILAWNAAHPHCAPMTVPEEKMSMVGPALLGLAVVAGVVIVAVRSGARANPRRRRRAS